MMLEALIYSVSADDQTAQQAKAWLGELRASVDRVFFHGFSGSSRVDGPFCYPAPQLEIEEYNRIRAKAANYCIKLGADKLQYFAPQPYVHSTAPKWEAQPFERATMQRCIAGLSDDDMQIRRSAAAALALRGSEALPAADRLKQLLTDPDVRLVAARALRAIGPKAKGAADAIAVLFDDDDSFVRMTGAMALGGLGKQSVPALRKAIKDCEPQVIKLAGHALADLGPAAAPAVPDLIPMVTSETELVRRATYTAIEGIGPAAAPATDALVHEFVRQGSRNHYIAWSLAAIAPGAKAAIPALEKARDDRYWSAGINAALFRIRGDKADLVAIVQLMRKPGGRYAQNYAAVALAKLGKEAAPVADEVRAFLKEQGDEFAKKNKQVVGNLHRYLDKTK